MAATHLKKHGVTWNGQLANLKRHHQHRSVLFYFNRFKSRFKCSILCVGQHLRAVTTFHQLKIFIYRPIKKWGYKISKSLQTVFM